MIAGGLGGGAVTVVAVLAILAGGDRREQSSALAGSPSPPPTRLQVSLQTHPDQRHALRKVLGYTEFLRGGTGARRQVALTFDDGPGPFTPKILRILRNHDAPATFFALGGMLEPFGRFARMAVRDGHVVAPHTNDHVHMGQLGAADQEAQLEETEAALRDAGIPDSHLFRPPYGSFNTETLDLLGSSRTLMTLWSVDTGDYLSPGTRVIVDRALAGAKPGAVILMHDAGGDRSQTVKALPKILRGLARRDLEPVTVPELLVADPPPRGQSIEQATAVPPPGAPMGG